MNRQLLNKVPQITVFFWLIKILCTTVGETFADFINFNLGIGLTATTILMGVALAVSLFFQFRAHGYRPFTYWLTVVLLSVFGTLVTDNMTDNMGVPLEVSTAIFSVLLALTFGMWYISERTLSIHSIYTVRREVFYWLTILFTFALGTAVGDLYSEQLGFGYLYTGIGVAAIIALIYMAYRYLKLNGILAFWAAYILTRPLGASLGDLLSQPAKNGGLGLGTTVTSIIFLVLILGIIIYLAKTKVDHTDENVAMTEVSSNKGAKWQTVALLAIFLIVGIGTYQLRMQTIAPHTTTLKGQLTAFIKTEDKIKNAKDKLVMKQGADQLEHEWDQQEPALRAIDAKKWTSVDTTIDGVLAAVRQSGDQTKVQQAVTQSEQVMQSIN
ncbi:hypothetical protein [Macrococcus brunensis]|uniref:COG4705 family protein n=1 Tax=Macrococcus brunensis TaxID=198483 RepID=UPI001EF074D0|nr:hypothetical protein [Macrococcus brunensis]ULG74432.1 hypothetical protein MGG13_01260 [Macrococcus brunensis]